MRSFFRTRQRKIIGLLNSMENLNIGLAGSNLWTPESVEKLNLMATPDVLDGLLETLGRYECFFGKVKKSKLNIDSDFRQILQLACESFGVVANLKNVPGVPGDCALHAYSPSGLCLFFSPNFLQQIEYDLLTLVSEPWFELFSREHSQDIDAFMAATHEFLNQGRTVPVDISSIPANALCLERRPGRPKVYSRGYFYSPLFDHNGSFQATLVASIHRDGTARDLLRA